MFGSRRREAGKGEILVSRETGGSSIALGLDRWRPGWGAWPERAFRQRDIRAHRKVTSATAGEVRHMTALALSHRRPAVRKALGD